MSVTYITESYLPTKFGLFKVCVFLDKESGKEHLALYMGDLQEDSQPILTRIHSECLTGDALFSLRCDCGPQLELAMQKISDAKKGVIFYLRQEGRGIGLLNKIRAYSLQDSGLDTVEANKSLGFEADHRNYDMCKEMFYYLKVKKINLMTNNPQKVVELQKIGIEIVNKIPHEVESNPFNKKYLNTKSNKLNHDLKSS